MSEPSLPPASRARRPGLWSAALASALACTPVPDQGSLEGSVVADGARVSLSGPLIGAALVTGEDGWLAVDVWSAASASGEVVVGPLCLWMRAEALGAVGPVELPSTWPEVDPPFTVDAWRCLPGTSEGSIFLGVRCAEPEPDPTPIDGIPVETTPVGEVTPREVEVPEHGPGETPTPAVEGNPRLIASGGTVEVVDATTQACDRFELRLTDVSFAGTDCEGVVQTLTFQDVRVSGIPLPPGRDWATGGFAECATR